MVKEKAKRKEKEVTKNTIKKYSNLNKHVKGFKKADHKLSSYLESAKALTPKKSKNKWSF